MQLHSLAVALSIQSYQVHLYIPMAQRRVMLSP